MATPFTRQKWSLWLQPGGPNTELKYLGCHTLDDLESPGQGIAEIIRCFKADGSGWETLGTVLEPPDMISTTATGLVYAAASELEKAKELGCEVPFHINGSLCPPYDVFGNYTRSFHMPYTRVGTQTLSNLAHMDEDGKSMEAYELTAWPPLVSARAMTLGRQTMAEYAPLNDVHFGNVAKCADDCGSALSICSYGVAVSDTPSGSPAEFGNVWYTQDGGVTWTQTAADPFAAGEHIISGVIFQIDATTWRLLVARDADAASPMEVAYSDDWGANWTTVNVGTVNNVGAMLEGALFVLNPYHIWLALSDGYIFFSDDFGGTWTLQTGGAGAPTSNDLNEVWFADDENGMAVGNSDTVLVTSDGGDTWTLATATGGGNNLRCCGENAGGGLWWVGESGGDAYYSANHGTTWARRDFPGDSVGQVNDVEFVNTLVGFLLHDNATPVGSVYRTRDGGYTWELMTDVTNLGLNSLHACNVNVVYAVGNPQPGGGAGTAVVLKGTD